MYRQLNNFKVVLCGANMRRWHNGTTAIVYNCCLAWPWRHQALFMVVGFGEDLLPMRWLHWACQAAIEDGLLFLASGGTAAAQRVLDGGCLGPWADPRHVGALPSEGEAVPPSLVRLNTDAPEVLWHWHASYAKNTAHMAGLFCATNLWPWKTEDIILANLDADNLITWE